MAREFLEKTLAVESLRVLRAKVEERIGGRLSNLESRVGWLFVSATPPSLDEGVRVGSLWVDTAVPVVKRTTVLDPLTFVEIEGTGGGAPADAEYLVGASHPDLSAERVVTNTATITWDLATAGQAKANVLAGTVSPAAHAASHQNGGSDEISVTGLSGLLADGQTPLAHAASHQDGGADEVALDASQVTTGTFPTARIADDAITGPKLRNSVGNSVIGFPGAIGGNPADIVASSANTFLTKRGVTVQFDFLLASDIPLHDILTGHNGFPGGTTNFLRADGTFASPTASVADPNPQSYTPGSFTVDTGKYVILSKRLNLITTQRATAVGTARIRMN